MSKSALVIINPKAGQEEASEHKNQLKEILSKVYSKVEIRETRGEGDAKKWAKEAGEKGFDLVVSIGGDGTVNETINGLALLDDAPLLGIVPLGTVNDLARALNIPLKAEEAMNLLIEGRTQRIDIGQANDQFFSNFLIIGEASKAIHKVPGDEKTKLGPLAYFIETGKKLGAEDRFDVQIELTNNSWHGKVSVIVVALIDSLGGLESVLKDAAIGDGQFLVLAIEKFTYSQIINMAPKTLAGKIEDTDNVHIFKSDQLSIKNSTDKKIPSDLDGEEGPNLPIDFKLFPRKLKVISALK
ncbi:MAG: diacylglycerol kinase family lipid kinase [Atopostipes suicloacalis]|nr:diacylglycerol kinase family lipid kinase [Atopostipes suicloacalis]MDN6731226.1 diacylglycerol kinase family lipid kinase [Atopostipes suicloacalis]